MRFTNYENGMFGEYLCLISMSPNISNSELKIDLESYISLNYSI